MAVTEARVRKNEKATKDLSPDGDEVTVTDGASGGGAPEGYGVAALVAGSGVYGGVENAKVANEGVSTRTAEEDDKRFKEADKFMNSKKEFGKKVDKSAKQIEKGEFNTEVGKALEEDEKKKQKEVDKKPTAPGANPADLNSPVAVKSAEQTRASEAADAAATQSAVAQAKGDTGEAEKKKVEAKKLEEQSKK